MQPAKILLHVAGLGAVGSHLVAELYKIPELLGKLKIVGYDFDIVEQHNLANQAYGQIDVGLPKAEALAEIFGIETENMKYPAYAPAPDILVMAVDSMQARRDIYYQSSAQFKLDTRLAEGAIVSLAGKTIRENFDYGDEEQDTSSPCQSSFHADKELVMQSVQWLLEQIESIVNNWEPAFKERRLIGGKVIDIGG